MEDNTYSKRKGELKFYHPPQNPWVENEISPLLKESNQENVEERRKGEEEEEEEEERRKKRENP